MKKILLLLLFLVPIIGCKTHKQIQKSETSSIDSVKHDTSNYKYRSNIDSAVTYIKGSNINYEKVTTITEYDTDKPTTKDIVLKGNWSLPVKCPNGKIYIDITDTTVKALFDTVNNVVTVVDNGKIKKIISGAVNTGLGSPIKKQTVITEKYSQQDSTKYWADKRRADSIESIKSKNETLKKVEQKKEETNKTFNVTPLNWLFIGLGGAVLIGIVIIVLKKVK